MSLAAARAKLRADVPSWYRGWAHFWFTTVWSLTVLVLAWRQVSEPTSAELAIVPIAFLVANLVEYLAHRYPMHHRTRGLTIFYDRHTVVHHNFYTHEAMAAESSRDFKMILFPANVAVAFVLGVGAPIAALFYWVVSPNAGWLFLGTALFYYLTYEWLHWSYHQPAGHWVRGVPGISILSRHHTLHHDPRQMTKLHFNITYPIFDWVFGTTSRAASSRAARGSSSR
jgi:hypothetical protein